MGKQLLDKAKHSKETYAPTAFSLFSYIDDELFDFEEFEKFIRESIFVIGEAHIRAFMNYKKKSDILEKRKEENN